MTAISHLEPNWQAVCARDEGSDGDFVYGVVTTGVYCRPSCKSRRPNRENVRFFNDNEAAEGAGFRACRRCRPTEPRADDVLLTRACRLIEESDGVGGTVAEIAEACEASESRLRRVFKARLDTTPHAYAQSHRAQRFKQLIKQGESVGMATYGAGYGSSSRLYEKADKLLGMTPATYRQRGRGEVISYAIRETPLGALLVAGTVKGLCLVRLGDSASDLEGELRREFAEADLVAADTELAGWTDALLAYLHGQSAWPDLPVDIQTTAFRARVYSALRSIPSGATATYSEIASAIGAPRAHRAVATACAQNPVPLAVPCHRVVPKSGGPGEYRFGRERKVRLLGLEKLARSLAG